MLIVPSMVLPVFLVADTFETRLMDVIEMDLELVESLRDLSINWIKWWRSIGIKRIINETMKTDMDTNPPISQF